MKCQALRCEQEGSCKTKYNEEGETIDLCRVHSGEFIQSAHPLCASYGCEKRAKYRHFCDLHHKEYMRKRARDTVNNVYLPDPKEIEFKYFGPELEEGMKELFVN